MPTNLIESDWAFPSDVLTFWDAPDGTRAAPPAPPAKLSYDWIIHQSLLPWLELEYAVPLSPGAAHVSEQMAAEARAVQDLAVPHRSEGSRGWRSMCLHGLGTTCTRGFQHYGYSTERHAPYRWTEIADKCPTTVRFLKQTFIFSQLNRVRLMVLDPGGYIAPHRDIPRHCLAAINIAITQPSGAYFKMRNYGCVPFRPGSAFLIDIGNEHCCINLSDEPRIHMIVHAEDPSPQFRGVVQRSFQKAHAQAC